uniref:Uncharacterized protein n=1 Tax=Tanacetum cinerariifolium TaxID=118510 RepID=A0A6L2KF60_TANCI|nr:hypothetical protein [Tanacetum cinerariifolium]
MNQATHISENSQRYSSICYDDDEERTIPLRNEDFNIIPEKESNEFIKSCVEDLVPIPNESEDISESDSTPLSEANDNECFNLGGDFDEIDAFLDIDTSTDVKDGVLLDHDTKSLKDESVIDD